MNTRGTTTAPQCSQQLMEHGRLTIWLMNCVDHIGFVQILIESNYRTPVLTADETDWLARFSYDRQYFELFSTIHRRTKREENDETQYQIARIYASSKVHTES